MNIYDIHLEYLDRLIDRHYRKEVLTPGEQENLKYLEEEYQKVLEKRDKLERN